MIRTWSGWLAAVVLCAGCRSDVVSAPLRVIIPAQIPAMSSGVLRATLWAYDPLLADAAASPVDVEAVPFAHVQRVQNEVGIRLEGHVPAGARYYVTVRGYDTSTGTGTERYILWDGLTSTEVPTTVVMQVPPIP